MSDESEPLPVAFSARLRLLRQRAGLSVPALAAAAGLTRQQVHGYESGSNEPRASTLARLAAALGVTLAAFDGCDYPS